ncbi:Protein BCP1 [Erysiphe neolycopersici]|uniref:Protein BCP1 n=1 Tax=Erysiphe neolycopersici TaxID=212602 RepID=A0A420HCX1_9PEZI|nr:Protein BCP1 [Erysiphe neolycopersici]
MVKKRIRDPELLVDAPVQENDGTDSDDEMDIVNVEFEWFNFKPEIDFHGVKNLLRQLFDVDAKLFNLSSLTDLILSQPTIGSTVKVEGEEADPYAIITILNLYEHRESPVIRDIIQYFLEKSKSISNLAPLALHLKNLSPIGLILSERLINVPAEVSAPLYNTLLDEIEAAVEDKEPYNFTHYLIFSKIYYEIESALDKEDAPKVKKNKAGNSKREIFYFHAEDEVLLKQALAFGTFDYTNDQGDGMADSKRAFSEMGIKSQGALIFIEANKFGDTIKAVNNLVNNST